jgi:hypothetical protein
VNFIFDSYPLYRHGSATGARESDPAGYGQARRAGLNRDTEAVVRNHLVQSAAARCGQAPIIHMSRLSARRRLCNLPANTLLSCCCVCLCCSTESGHNIYYIMLAEPLPLIMSLPDGLPCCHRRACAVGPSQAVRDHPEKSSIGGTITAINREHCTQWLLCWCRRRRPQSHSFVLSSTASIIL